MEIASSPLLYTQSLPLDSRPEVKMQTEQIFRIILTVHKIKQGLGIRFLNNARGCSQRYHIIPQQVQSKLSGLVRKREGNVRLLNLPCISC